MPKLRVYQLARELNRDNSEIIRELQHMGVPVTSHSNTVEDRLADSLRKKLGVFEEPAKGKGKAAPPPDEIISVESPVIEPPPPPPPAPPVEPVRVEAKVETKIEAKIEPKVEPKPAAPVAPPPVEKVAAAAPPVVPPVPVKPAPLRPATITPTG